MLGARDVLWCYENILGGCDLGYCVKVVWLTTDETEGQAGGKQGKEETADKRPSMLKLHGSGRAEDKVSISLR